MAKRPLKLSIRLPPYKPPRNAWRRLIHAAVLSVQQRSPVCYEPNDKLEVRCKLYLRNWALSHHDVDNRLKDILDALQGRAGGPKKRQALQPIIPNDRQVYRVLIEKFPCRAGSNGSGLLTIRRLPRWRIRWGEALSNTPEPRKKKTRGKLRL